MLNGTSSSCIIGGFNAISKDSCDLLLIDSHTIDTADELARTHATHYWKKITLQPDCYTRPSKPRAYQIQKNVYTNIWQQPQTSTEQVMPYLLMSKEILFDFAEQCGHPAKICGRNRGHHFVPLCADHC
jgi:hypothetical protein